MTKFLSNIELPDGTILPDDTGWIEATLLNGWANWNTASFVPARYRKKDGVVYLEGFINPSASTNIHAFTLPAEFRPDLAMYVTILTAVDAGSHAQMRVSSGGAVQFANHGASQWISFAYSYPVD